MSGYDHDPVKDLFDREREQIVSQHGNDLHWQSIVRRARAQRRSRFLGYAAGMTAAGLVIGGVTYGAFLHNEPALVPAATAPAPATAPIPSTSVRTKPAAPTAETEIVVLRPVTASGRPAAGYTVTDEKTTTVTCGGPYPAPSRVAVDDNILDCSPTAAYAVACWKDPAPSTAICYQDPWSKKLARMPAEGSFPTVTARSPAQPLGLQLSDGDHCGMREGGSAAPLARHPGWYPTYWCTSGRAVWGHGDGATGVDRSSPRWTVDVAPASGSGPLSARRVLKAYFIGTQGG